MRYPVIVALLGILTLLGIVGLPLLSGSTSFPEDASPEEVGRFISGVAGYWRAVFESATAQEKEETTVPLSPTTPEAPSSMPTHTPSSAPTSAMPTLSRDAAMKMLKEYVQMIIMPLDFRWELADRRVLGLRDDNQTEACLRENRLFDLASNMPELSQFPEVPPSALIPTEEGARFTVDQVVHEESETVRGIFKVADVRVIEVLPIPVTNYPWVPVRFRYEIRKLTAIGECLALNEYLRLRVGRIVDLEVLFQLFDDGWRLTNAERGAESIPCPVPDPFFDRFSYTDQGLYPFCLLDEDAQRGRSLRATQPELFTLITDLQRGQTITFLLEPDPWESKGGARNQNLSAALETTVKILRARLREHPDIAYTFIRKGEQIRLEIECLAVEGCRMTELLAYVGAQGQLEFKKVLRVGSSPGESLQAADPSEEVLLDRDGIPCIVARKPLLTRSAIRSARVDSTNPSFIRLDLQLTEGGAKELARLLVSGVLKGGEQPGDGLGDRLAIVLDGIILSAPSIDTSFEEAARLQGWRALMEASINIGSFQSRKEPERIATIINAGPLPIRVRVSLETEETE
jgi:hypothetical protein